MTKKFIKILIIIGLFFTLINNSFAFSGKLEIDKDTNNINDNVNLRVIINSDKGGEISITKIKGLENFEKIGQSQSQSQSTQVISNNGKTQSKTISTVNLDLILKAKKKGNYVIGPATIQMGTKKIETNSVKIKVDGTNISVLNNNIVSNKNSNKNSPITPKTNSPIIPFHKGDENKNNSTKIGNSNITNKQSGFGPLKKIKNNFDNYITYLLIIIFILSLFGIYIFNKSKTVKNSPIIPKKNSPIIPFLKEDENKNNISTSKEGLEEVEKKEIIYPEVGEKDFIEKINSTFRNKIAQKFNIENIETLTFQEILGITGKIDNIEEIVNLINESKYSNINKNEEKILDLVKKF